MCQIVINGNDPEIYRNLLKILGQIYMDDLKNNWKGLETFKKLRDLASYKSKTQTNNDFNDIPFDLKLKLFAY